MAESPQTAARSPRVLLLYYSYTGQARKVLEAAATVFRARGYEVTEAPIEFTDPRYAERFSRFPMRSVWPEFLGMLPAQTMQRTGDIRTPDAVRTGDYDLICIGSPTWWDTVSMPLRSFLKSHEARPLLEASVSRCSWCAAASGARTWPGCASSPRRRAAATSTASTSPIPAASCPRCCR